MSEDIVVRVREALDAALKEVVTLTIADERNRRADVNGPQSPANKPTSDDFADRLRTVRKLRNLSQGDLAERTGLQPSAVSHFESDRRTPSFDNLKRLADALNVSADYLLGRIDLIAMFVPDSRTAPEPEMTIARMIEKLKENLNPRFSAIPVWSDVENDLTALVEVEKKRGEVLARTEYGRGFTEGETKQAILEVQAQDKFLSGIGDIKREAVEGQLRRDADSILGLAGQGITIAEAKWIVAQLSMEG